MEDKTTVLPKKEGTTTLPNKPVKPVPKKPNIPKKPILPQNKNVLTPKPEIPVKPKNPKQVGIPTRPEKPAIPKKPAPPIPTRPEKPTVSKKPVSTKPEQPIKPEKLEGLEKSVKPEKPKKDKIINKTNLENNTEISKDNKVDNVITEKTKKSKNKPKNSKDGLKDKNLENNVDNLILPQNENPKETIENLTNNSVNNEKFEEQESKNGKNKKNNKKEKEKLDKKEKEKLDKKEEEDFKLKSKNDDFIEESLQNTDLNQANKKRKKKRLLLLLLLLLLIPILVGLGVMLYFIFNYTPPEVIYHTNVVITDSEIEKQYDENNKEITYLPGNYIKFENPIKISSKLDGEENYFPMAFRFKIQAFVEGKEIENGLGVSFKDDSIIYNKNNLPLLTDHEGQKYYIISNDYYYSTEIIVPGKTVIETIDKIYLNPAVLHNEFANKKLEVVLTVDSIYPQASYFDEAWPETEQEYREMIIAKLENNLY